jgi:dTDP-4-amino-4,6-dideoxygalactose transaminase
VHQLSYFGRACTKPAGGLPGADVLFEQLLSLPMYPRLTDQQVDMVCDVLADSLTHSTNL